MEPIPLNLKQQNGMFAEIDLDNFEYKKALLLLHTVVLFYNGLDDKEKEILKNLSEETGTEDELEWAIEFVNKDLYSAFQRMVEYFNENISEAPKKVKLDMMVRTWESLLLKGNVSEMEALALLKLSRIFGIESDFVKIIRKN